MRKTILWDFDGVILDSMQIRAWGFREIFKNYDKSIIDQLLNYHFLNGGLSRYVKIKYFFEELLGESITNKKIYEYANKYSLLMRKSLTDVDNLISDSVNFIKSNHEKYNFHIVSGSDQEELRFLNKKLRISDYFISIHGSPKIKKQIVSELITNHKYIKSNTCLIGDSINDFEAAIENEITFFGYNNHNLKETTSTYINSFDDFKF